MKNRRKTVRTALLCLVAGAGGCTARPHVADAGANASSPGADAGGAVPLQLRIEARLSDGGFLGEPLGPGLSPFLPVTRELAFTSNRLLYNYRLRVLDEVDRALASDDTPVETPMGLRYGISLLAPLRSGHRYSVVLDAQSGATLDDGSGAAINEERFDFHTDGEREKDTPLKPGRAKQRHRRDEAP